MLDRGEGKTSTAHEGSQKTHQIQVKNGNDGHRSVAWQQVAGKGGEALNPYLILARGTTWMLTTIERRRYHASLVYL